MKHALAILLLFAAAAPAAWLDGGAAWEYRRPLDVLWDADRASGEELAEAEFYTAGHHKPNGEDIRIATLEGRAVPFRVLQTGPGDRVRVLFNLSRSVRQYAAYFGNPAAAAPPPSLEGPPRFGLLLETRKFAGGKADNPRQLEEAWNRGGAFVGCRMIDRPFIANLPFPGTQQTVSRYTGSLFAPMNGDYFFAASCEQRGVLLIDGRPVLTVRRPVRDAQFNATLRLTRGRHEFAFYQMTHGGEGMISVCWRRPDMSVLEPIGREAFGIAFTANPGALEGNPLRRTLTSDFDIRYLGECVVAGRYSHRYRFVARAAKNDRARFEWDLGDGQTASAGDLEHVFLLPGVYGVKLTTRVGNNSDTQTIRVAAERDYERLDRPASDEPATQAKLVARYDLARLTPAHLPQAVNLLLRANQRGEAVDAAMRLAAATGLPDRDAALNALDELTRDLLSASRLAQAIDLWAAVPQSSNLQPAAVRQLAQLLLWRQVDFARAVKVLEPFSRSDGETQRLFGQALVLDQKADQGAKVLRQIPPKGPADRQAAISGAMARTVEYFIAEKDAEAGEEKWEQWQSQYPADFLEGYSVLLRARLMEIKKTPEAAAAVAEAFARALPSSSYAPRLLHLAAGLNPGRAAELRALLKQRYPEDPLSQ